MSTELFEVESLPSIDDITFDVGLVSSYEFNELPAKDLHVDREHYQRHINTARVKRIAKNFDPMLFDVLKVNRRADGTYWVIDGGHRLSALSEMGRTEEYVPCLVYDGLTLQEEAALFAAQNNRAQVTAGHEFRALLASGDPTTLAIKQIVEAEGLILDLPPHVRNAKNGIRATRALQRIMWQGRASMLQKVLRTAHFGLGETVHSFKSEVLMGIFTFYTYFPEANDTRMAAKLNTLGVDKFRLAAVEFKHLMSGAPKANPYAWIMYREYNKNLSSNRLASWSPADRRPHGTDAN